MCCIWLAALPTQVMLGALYTLRFSREGSSPLSLRCAPWVRGGVTFGSRLGIRTSSPSLFTFHSGPEASASGSLAATTKFLIPQTACYPLSWLLCQPSAVSSCALVGASCQVTDSTSLPLTWVCTMAFTHGGLPDFSPHASSSLCTNWERFLCSAKFPNPGVLFSRLLVNPPWSRGSFGVKGGGILMKMLTQP